MKNYEYIFYPAMLSQVRSFLESWRVKKVASGKHKESTHYLPNSCIATSESGSGTSKVSRYNALDILVVTTIP